MKPVVATVLMSILIGMSIFIQFPDLNRLLCAQTEQKCGFVFA